MKKFVFCLSLLSATSAHAELYKWVGPDGQVNYTDTPPLPTVKNVQEKSFGIGGINTSSLPYDLVIAVQKNPVTLFSTASCRPCNDARTFLNTRGIPFVEKIVSTPADQQQLKQSGGSDSMPFLQVGTANLHGFDPSEWGSALTNAGYPASSRLPKSYQNPPASPAALPKSPIHEEVDASKSVPEKPARSIMPPAPPVNSAPPGFRF